VDSFLYLMPAKPIEIRSSTIYTYWDFNGGLTCPLCFMPLQHEFNNGGRKIIMLKGPLWVITNYYSCSNPACELHQAFSAVYPSMLDRKKFPLDVWAKVVQHHFKHHLNYSTIADLMWDDWDVSISPGAVRSICEFFEMAGTQHANETVLKEVRANGKIVVSLDGAQPIKGEPSLWIFSDLLTGNVLLARELDTAPAAVLREIFREIEALYGVPIVAVVSDKQKNIVNAVKLFNPDLPHAYCHYHFLNHVVEPIASKDSHLQTELQKEVRKLSIVVNAKNSDSNNFYALFSPMVEELKCAISARGDRFKSFPGIETFANLEHVLAQLQPYLAWSLPQKVVRSLSALIESLTRTLTTHRELYQEIRDLIPDFERVREILSHREKDSASVKREVEKWVLTLQDRLKARNFEWRPEHVKWQQSSFKTSREEVWQEWIRLEQSYHEGLFVAYDNREVDFTNNAKEQLFHRCKHHFKSLLGRANVAQAFQEHGSVYAQLMNLDYSKERVSSVLLACETPLIESERKEFHAQYATVARTWRIREQDTGNLKLFERALTNYTR